MIALLFHDVYLRDPAESGFSSPAADRYKLSLAQFDAQLFGVAAASAGDACLLTFDDGGVSFYSIVADRLEAHGWRGHCFVSTDFIGRRGFLEGRHLRELQARGHVIGSHSVSHPARIDTMSVSNLRHEWADSRSKLENVLGQPVLTASIPGGWFSRRVADAAHEAGFTTLFTSEPTTTVRKRRSCALVGRFAIRSSSAADYSERLITSRLTRVGQRLSWNAKALVKPLLGSSYGHVADLLLRRPGTASHVR